MKLTFTFFIFFLFSIPSFAGDYETALQKLSEGKRGECENLLQKALENGNAEEKNKAALDLMALYAEEGRSSDALSVYSKSRFLDHSFFMQFEKGWALLSLNRTEEAIKSFNKAKAFTANQALLSQADFAAALSEARRKKTEKALENMAAVYTRYPYLLSSSSQLIGRWLMLKKDYDKASYFTGSSLQYDNKNFQAEADFAEISEKQKKYTAAWQAWRTLREMDPEEKRYDRKLRKLAKRVKGEHENLMFWQRMNWPAHTSLRKVHGGKKIKVNLYADNEGKSARLLEFSFMSSADFDIMDDRLGKLMSGKKFTPWKIIYDPKEKLIEIHDSLGSSARSTYGNLTVTCRKEGAVILLKDPLFAGDPAGVNRSDRETGGGLRIMPAEDGVKLQTIIDEESLACPITASLIRRSNEMNFSKAVAVAVRSKIRNMAAHSLHGDEADMCDSAHCIEFAGMQAENMLATAAVEETLGQVIVSSDNAVPNVYLTQACGGTSHVCAEGVDHAETGSPFSLYASLIAGPAEGLMCIPESRLNYIDLNWTLILAPEWIESRINRHKKIGRLKYIIPLKRDENGSVLSIRAYGSAGFADFEGEKAISSVLASGTLRSMLFSIRPVMKGKYPEYFLVRGMGTFASGPADGKNMCLRGAEGMAARQDADYRAILKKYFPGTHLSPEEPDKLPVPADEQNGNEQENNLSDSANPAESLGKAAVGSPVTAGSLSGDVPSSPVKRIILNAESYLSKQAENNDDRPSASSESFSVKNESSVKESSSVQIKH